MNERDHETFLQLIRDRLGELDGADRLGEQAQAVVPLDQQAVGRLSRMDALQSQAMARAQQMRRDDERRRLAGALHRLETGEYGYCDDCGDAIPRRRLQLNLAATRCVGCAASR